MLHTVKKYIKSRLLSWLKNIEVDSSSEINFNIRNSSKSRAYPSKVFGSRCDIVSLGEGCYISDAIVDGNVSIGRFVSIMGPGVVIKCLGSEIKIGSFSSIGQNVCIYDFSHNVRRPTSIFYNHIILGGDFRDDLWQCSNIVIEEDVWIGSNSVILPGVTVGRGAVIGAGSVVTKDIPPYSIAFGNPAARRFSRFPDDVIAMLEKERWWEYQSRELAEKKEFFLSDLVK